jgi:hypothetical protein
LETHTLILAEAGKRTWENVARVIASGEAIFMIYDPWQFVLWNFYEHSNSSKQVRSFIQSENSEYVKGDLVTDFSYK